MEKICAAEIVCDWNQNVHVTNVLKVSYCIHTHVIVAR